MFCSLVIFTRATTVCKDILPVTNLNCRIPLYRSITTHWRAAINTFFFKSLYRYLFIFSLLVHAAVSTVAAASDTPVFVAIPEQNIDAGQKLEFVVAATVEGDQPPWLSTDFFTFSSGFRDNGDGTRAFRWFTKVEDIGQHIVTFVARNPFDPTIQSSIDVVVNVLPVLDTGPDLRVIAPDEISIMPGELVSFRVQAIDSSGAVPSLYLSDEYSREGATLADNGDGTRTFSWQVPETINLGGAIGVAYPFEIVAVSATDPDRVVIHEFYLDYSPGFELPEMNSFPALILPAVTAVAAGDRIVFRVAAATASGEVPNIRVMPLFEGVTFDDNGDGTRTFAWTTSPVDGGDWPFVFVAEDPADGTSVEEVVVISVAQ